MRNDFFVVVLWMMLEDPWSRPIGPNFLNISSMEADISEAAPVLTGWVKKKEQL